jgi:hypothetical protein
MRKWFAYLALGALALAAGCASGAGRLTFAGGEGATFDTAVVIHGAHNLDEGFQAEQSWLAGHFPGAKISPAHFFPIGPRRYDLFVVTTAGGQAHDVYFDVTSFLRPDTD